MGFVFAVGDDVRRFGNWVGMSMVCILSLFIAVSLSTGHLIPPNEEITVLTSCN